MIPTCRLLRIQERHLGSRQVVIVTPNLYEMIYMEGQIYIKHGLQNTLLNISKQVFLQS